MGVERVLLENNDQVTNFTRNNYQDILFSLGEREDISRKRTNQIKIVNDDTCA